MHRFRTFVQSLGRTPWSLMLILSAVLFVSRVLYLQFVSPYGLAPDEAQYWHWLTHLQLAYVTKPPLTTWLIGASTALLGHTLIGVKLFALLGQVAVPLLLARLTQQLIPHTPHTHTAMWLAFLAGSSSPFIAAGGLIMGPDAVLLPLWLAALSLTLTALASPQPRPRTWLLIGALIGLAGLAKTSAALFFPLLFLVLLLTRSSLLRNPWPYLSALVALACQAPVIWWNVQNDFATLHHLLWQTSGGGDTRHGGISSVADFLASQLLLGLITFPILLYLWFRLPFSRLAPHASRLLWLFTFPIFALFLLQSTGAKVQPNWPLLATIPAIPLVAAWVATRPWPRRALIVGCIIGAAVSLVLHHTPLARQWGVPLPLKIDPTRPMLGNLQFGQLTASLMGQLAPNSIILTTRYQTAAIVSFHTAIAIPTTRVTTTPVHYLNPGYRRANQYDLWPLPDLKNRLVLYINEQSNLPDVVKNMFATCLPWQRALVSGPTAEIYYRPSYFLCYNPK